MKKFKIAIFHLAFLYSGGGERLVLTEALEFLRRGHEVVCFAPVINRQKCFPELMENARVEKILPRILPKWFPDIEFFSILASCLFLPLVFYKFRKYDIYFGANQPGVWMAWLLGRINRKPSVGYLAQPTRLIHPRLVDQEVGLRLRDGFSLLNIVSFFLRPFIYVFDVWSIRGVGKIFVNGSYAKGIIDQVYRINTVLCPGGTRIFKRGAGLNKKKLGGYLVINGKRIERPYILITNRNFGHKKFEYAIEALGFLKKKMNLVITGDETKYTRSLINKYGNGRVTFTRLLSEQDLSRVYAGAYVYVYPAPEEDFGMGIIEAMSYGVPVVAWGNGGPTGIIEHGVNGLLARPFVIEDFAEQIERLLRDRNFYEKIVKGADELVLDKYTVDTHVDILEKGIEEVWDERRKSK